MIMTLAMATFLQGVLILIAGGSAVSVQNPLLAWLGNARPHRHSGGRHPLGDRVGGGARPSCTRRRSARGSSRSAPIRWPARLSGVSVRATTMTVYAVSGFTAGLAGVLVLGMNGQGYVGIGDPYLLASIAAVVLGGTSILGGSRHLCRHHSGRHPARHDHGADHRRQCLARLAQHPLRLADSALLLLSGRDSQRR